MNRVTELLKIRYPIIQGGMVWCSGWKLASSVSNAGGLGLIGAGSMEPSVLRDHILKCKGAISNNKSFGINVPLLYHHADDMMDVIVQEGVKIVFTSAGSPKKYTSYLHSNGVTVVHVVANQKFASKCVEAGVDAVVAEGFEAGGHNGLEETTTFTLIPLIREVIGDSVPLIAAGGVASGQSMLAAMALGADAVQVGSLFAASIESSAHENFKNAIVDAGDGSTRLVMKNVVPVRMLRNDFFDRVREAESRGADVNEMKKILGSGRAERGMFQGDMKEGELEIGQVAGLIHETKSASTILEEMMAEYRSAQQRLCRIHFD